MLYSLPFGFSFKQISTIIGYIKEERYLTNLRGNNHDNGKTT